MLAHDHAGRTDKFGARPSAATDVARTLFLGTCCFWFVHNRRTYGRIVVLVATRRFDYRSEKLPIAQPFAVALMQ